MKNLILTLTLFGSSFLMAQTDANFVSFNPLPDNEVSVNSSVLTDKIAEATEVKKVTYKDHIFEAQSFNIPLIESNEHMDSLILANQLIPVPEEGEGYKIQKLVHSRAFLNNQAYLILKEITSQFLKETNNELSISSLTRTAESQKKLSRVNSNATKGHSAHSYGASFDISYSKYGDKLGRNYANEKVVQQILDQLVESGKIYYIKERRQPCFHVTVRNPSIENSTENIEHS